MCSDVNKLASALAVKTLGGVKWKMQWPVSAFQTRALPSYSNCYQTWKHIQKTYTHGISHVNSPAMEFKMLEVTGTFLKAMSKSVPVAWLAVMISLPGATKATCTTEPYQCVLFQCIQCIPLWSTKWSLSHLKPNESAKAQFIPYYILLHTTCGLSMCNKMPSMSRLKQSNSSP